MKRSHRLNSGMVENGQFMLIAIILICITMMLMVIKLLVDRDSRGMSVVNDQRGLCQVDPTLLFKNGVNVRAWKDQLELYFAVNAISQPSLKAQMTLRHLDAEVLKTIKSSIMDGNGHYDFNKIMAALSRMYGQKDMAAMKYRTIFNERHQEKEENVHSYLAALNELAMKAYPAGEIVEDTRQKYILERFMYGFSDKVIREKLLMEQPSSLSKAVEMAEKLSDIFNLTRSPEEEEVSSHKQQEQSVVTYRNRRNSSEVNNREHGEANRSRIQKSLRFEDEGPKCWSCGELGHTKWNCSRQHYQSSPRSTTQTPRQYSPQDSAYSNGSALPSPNRSYRTQDARTVVCHACQRQGHYANNCPNKLWTA